MTEEQQTQTEPVVLGEKKIEQLSNIAGPSRSPFQSSNSSSVMSMS